MEPNDREGISFKLSWQNNSFLSNNYDFQASWYENLQTTKLLS